MTVEIRLGLLVLDSKSYRSRSIADRLRGHDIIAQRGLEIRGDMKSSPGPDLVNIAK